MPSKNRNSTPDLSSNSNKKDSKSAELICLVCGAPATGFNFSVITCMCCKAFFRRNALCGLESYQCRYLTDNCTINMRSRRDCSYCRLKKCFQVGMKKELILTEDAKRIKREKLQANRQMTLSLMTRTDLNNENDLTVLRNISNAYEQNCYLPLVAFEKREYETSLHQPLKARLKFQYYIDAYHEHHKALNGFFKCLPEFQKLPQQEQVAISSHNLKFIMRYNGVELMNDSFPVWGAANLVLHVFYGERIMETLEKCLQEFKKNLSESVCIRTFMIILLFTTVDTSNERLNALTLYNIQEKYTELLWTYLVQRYGDIIAAQKFSSVIRWCLNFQSVSHLIELKKQEAQWQEQFSQLNK